MATQTLYLVLSLLLLSAALSSVTATNTPSPSPSTKPTAPPPVDDDEDLSFLEEPVDDSPKPPSYVYDDEQEVEAGEYGSYEDFKEWNSANPHTPTPAVPAVDEKDVVVLNGTNFTDFITLNKYAMVEFYAPWCSYCQALAPEYAAAATELKDAEVKLAKVDAMEDGELATKYQVDGFPAIFFFADGEYKQYNGERSREAIVAWIRKKIGPGVQNVTTTEEAENILRAESKAVVAYLDNLTGKESEVFASAARQEDDDINYYQTTSPDVAKVFLFDHKAKRPALVLLKKQVEKLSKFDGEFSKPAITEFVSANKLPLVVNFTRETSPVVFENPIKKQVLLFAPANESEKLIPTFEEAAKSFKGKLIFVYVEMDNNDFGRPVSEYFGINGVSTKILAYSGNEDARKFLLDGDFTLDQIKLFAEDFLADKLKPFYKSEPVPEMNDGDVKVVVGQNFEDVILDESKDVLLEVYAPWCPHCHALEPVYKKLAQYLNGVDSMVIAKIDGTANEHPRAKSDGFPTILFFPAGKKSFDPIVYEGERTVVEMYKFLKKNASIPFKIKKPTTPPKSNGVDVTITKIEAESSRDSKDLKDEL